MFCFHLFNLNFHLTQCKKRIVLSCVMNDHNDRKVAEAENPNILILLCQYKVCKPIGYKILQYYGMLSGLKDDEGVRKWIKVIIEVEISIQYNRFILSLRSHLQLMTEQKDPSKESGGIGRYSQDGEEEPQEVSQFGVNPPSNRPIQEEDQMEEGSASSHDLSYLRRNQRKAKTQQRFRYFLLSVAFLVFLGCIIYLSISSSNQSVKEDLVKQKKSETSSIVNNRQKEQKQQVPVDKIKKPQVPPIELNKPIPPPKVTPVAPLVSQNQGQSKYSREIHPFDCTPYESMYHYFDANGDKLYYATKYRLFIPCCQINWVLKLGRQHYQQWDKQRSIIEWARLNVRRGQKVLYDCGNCDNFQELIILSKFVGSGGQLTITRGREVCMNDALNLNSVKNIQFFNQQPELYKKYDVVISTNEIFFDQEVDRGLMQNGAKKMLVRFTNPASVLNTLKKIKQRSSNSARIKKVRLDNNDCKGIMQVDGSQQGSGYYEITVKKQQLSEEQSSNNVQQHPILKQLYSQYDKFISALPSPFQKKDINNIMKNFNIQPDQLSSSNQEWKNRMEVIEWARNRTTEDSVVLYQYQSESTNLFVLFNVASLIPKGRVVVRCSAQNWRKIQQHKTKLSISNIERKQENQQILLLEKLLIITDNVQTMKSVASERTLDNRLILGYFSKQNKEGLKLLYQLYVKYHIRKVDIVPSFYFGYQVFDHFFWHSQSPEGFFQIQKKGYVIYQIWSQEIAKINSNRRFCINQIIRSNTPQIKIMNPTILPYFEVPESPFNKAFQYLSAVHRADYLRCYLLHQYGGGYSDIKHIHDDYQPYFQQLHNGPQDKYAVGYPEKYAIYPTCFQTPGEDPCYKLKQNYNKIMGADSFIHKRQSPITTEWFRRITKVLDENYERLKQNPAQHYRDRIGMMITVNGRNVRSNYPLRWQQINAEPYARSQWKYFGHYYVSLPYIDIYDYR